jgi:hypothetical protein
MIQVAKLEILGDSDAEIYSLKQTNLDFLRENAFTCTICLVLLCVFAL